MSLRSIIAVVIYPIFASTLFGIGLTAALAGAGSVEVSLVPCALAALLLSVPLSLQAAPVLASRQERGRIDEREQ